jgi:hypothetical protein
MMFLMTTNMMGVGIFHPNFSNVMGKCKLKFSPIPSTVGRRKGRLKQKSLTRTKNHPKDKVQKQTLHFWIVVFIEQEVPLHEVEVHSTFGHLLE